MGDKYYIPTIEEFHIGFEYQGNDGAEWFDKTCNAFDMMDIKTMMNKHQKIDRIRVKYLDQEDIESLGFIYVVTGVYGDLEFKARKSKAINHDDIYHLSLLQSWVTIKHKLEGGMDSSWYTLFDGIIKNKSELKKILKQVGYEQ